MRISLRRVWINQPSTKQVDHKFHGLNGLIAIKEWNSSDLFIDFWPTSGDVVSMRIAKLSLSYGWKSEMNDTTEKNVNPGLGDGAQHGAELAERMRKRLARLVCYSCHGDLYHYAGCGVGEHGDIVARKDKEIS